MEYLSVLGKKLQDQFHLKHCFEFEFWGLIHIGFSANAKCDHEVPLVTDGTSLTDQHVVMEYLSVLGKKLQDQFHLKHCFEFEFWGLIHIGFSANAKCDHEVPLVTDGTSLTDQHVVMEYLSVLVKKLQD